MLTYAQPHAVLVYAPCNPLLQSSDAKDGPRESAPSEASTTTTETGHAA